MNNTTIIYLFCFLSFLLKSSLGIAQADKLAMDSYQKAENVLRKTIQKHGGQAQLNAPIGFKLEGSLYFFGHYDVPEKTIPAPDTDKITFFPDLGISYLYSAVNYYGDRSKIIMNHQDSTYYVGYFDRDFSKGKLQERNQLYLTYPAQMLLLADKNKNTLAFIGEDNIQSIISFNEGLGIRYNLCIDKKTNRLQKVTQLTYSDIYGDGFDEFIYEYADATTTQPSKYTRREHGLLESAFVYKDFKTEPKIDTGFVKYMCPTCKIESTKKENDLSIESIGKNLSLISLKHLDNKMLLAEFQTYIVLFEAPKDAKTCQEVINLVKKQFPNKPIKYAAFSHHHPDHAGGFSAFVQNNTQLITTKGNVPYFEKLLKTTHTLKPENTISSAKMSVKTIASKDSLTIKDQDNEVIIYERGENTDHVQEYLWFYFPKQKILFVGDLVVFYQEGIVDQAERAYSVYKIIKDKKLDVEKIYTAWPLEGQKSFGTMQDLKASLIKNYPELKEK
jgi:Metallo-beta-lactamase superfamily